MTTGFDIVFEKLKDILQKYSSPYTVKEEPGKYSVCGKPGPATLKVWGGKMKKPVMPVGYIEIGKAYVSYHLMGVYGNPKLLEGISKDLKARMQGKSCFNFKKVDENIFKELDQLTAKTINGFRKAGFVTE